MPQCRDRRWVGTVSEVIPYGRGIRIIRIAENNQTIRVRARDRYKVGTKVHMVTHPPVDEDDFFVSRLLGKVKASPRPAA